MFGDTGGGVIGAVGWGGQVWLVGFGGEGLVWEGVRWGDGKETKNSGEGGGGGGEEERVVVDQVAIAGDDRVCVVTRLLPMFRFTLVLSLVLCFRY